MSEGSEELLSQSSAGSTLDTLLAPVEHCHRRTGTEPRTFQTSRAGQGGELVDYMLDGKTALVTGGASGIGRACARLLAAEGARVVVADVNDLGAKETVEAIATVGGTAVAVHMDVSDPNEVERGVGYAFDEFGSLDCAINCAAITLNGGNRVPTAEVSLETFDRLTAVDLRGTFLCSSTNC